MLNTQTRQTLLRYITYKKCKVGKTCMTLNFKDTIVRWFFTAQVLYIQQNYCTCLEYLSIKSKNKFQANKRMKQKVPAKIITDADYADDIELLANAPAQAVTLLHNLKRVAAGIGLQVNAHKTEYMCFNQTGDISTLNGSFLKLVDKFSYLGSSVSSTEIDIGTRLAKAWTAIDMLSVIWKSNLTDKIKRSFFQAAIVSVLLCWCTMWKLTKRMEKKLDGNYIRMLRAILNTSWRQHSKKQQLYGHQPPFTKTIKIRRIRHAGHCWRSRDELISDILLWTPSHGRAKAGQSARTYKQQLCADTGCSPEDLPEAMDVRDGWRERVRDIRAENVTWWWLFALDLADYNAVGIISHVVISMAKLRRKYLLLWK